MKRDEYGIPICECHSAEQFIANLNEIHSRWRDGTWIYRGQNDASLPLLPKAMRKDSLVSKLVEKNLDNFNRRAIVTNNKAKTLCEKMDDDEFCGKVRHALHVSIEKKVVAAFTELADQSRIHVPTDGLGIVGGSRWPLNRLMRYYVNKACLGRIEHHPKSVIYALAQHHGIPTRLLDWTFRSMVAAFFAAYEDDNWCHSTDYTTPKAMGVWAVKWNMLAKSGLMRITRQRTLIGNLQAQEGVFLYNPLADRDRPTDDSWLNFECLLRELIPYRAVYKITLPYSQRKKVLKLLARKGYRRPYLMPTFDIVAEEFTSGRLDPIEFHESY